MAEKGYERASVQAIARAAGLTPGLVHYHFRSKQKVLLALVERLGERIHERFLTRAPRSEEESWERLNAFIDAHLAIDEEADPRTVACWVAIGAEALRQPEVRERYELVVRRELDLLESLVSEVLGHEGRSTDEAGHIAAGLMSAIQGSYQLAVAARATPEGFASPMVRRMAEGLIRSSGDGR